MIMSGIDINKELLIALIEKRPVLWDKRDTYKDRNATKGVWNKVCLGLKEDFETLKDSGKKWVLLTIDFHNAECLKIVESQSFP
jgi:hypothetical protein